MAATAPVNQAQLRTAPVNKAQLRAAPVNKAQLRAALAYKAQLGAAPAMQHSSPGNWSLSMYVLYTFISFYKHTASRD